MTETIRLLIGTLMTDLPCGCRVDRDDPSYDWHVTYRDEGCDMGHEDGQEIDKSLSHHHLIRDCELRKEDAYG